MQSSAKFGEIGGLRQGLTPQKTPGLLDNNCQSVKSTYRGGFANAPRQYNINSHCPPVEQHSNT
jgi:hypothetical protein